jgi:hypothetical protein
MKLLNIAHFHPSRLLSLFEPAGALKGSRHVGTDFWISFRQLRRRRSPIRELDVAAWCAGADYLRLFLRARISPEIRRALG